MVRVKPYKRRGVPREGAWEADIRVKLPNGRWRRERVKAPGGSKAAAVRWAHAREHELLFGVPEEPKKEVPTLAEFAPRFIEGHAVANRHKPSGIAGKQTVIRLHLIPNFGHRRLDSIGNEAVQKLKVSLRDKQPATVNNTLTCLNMMLKVAVQWGVLEQMPCTIRLLPVPPTLASFHDLDEYRRLLDAARRVDERAYILCLLGGQAGMRCGEMMALEWTDVDLVKKLLKISRSDWKGHVTTTKGNRPRIVPMTKLLVEALAAYRHLKGKRVLYQDDGKPMTQKVVQDLVRKASRLANLPNVGVHVLRHSFCSHLAMALVQARSIQELAGHKDLSTTQRYMHLSPAAVDDAIRRLEMAHAQGPGAVADQVSAGGFEPRFELRRQGSEKA